MSMEMQAWNSLYQAMHAQRRDAAVLPGHAAAHRRVRPPAPAAAGGVPRAQRRRRRAGGGDAGAGRPGGRRDRRRRADRAVVVGLAVLIAVIAVAEAGLGHASRGGSRRAIGEGLILDLRAAVFDHVQRMPVAFFTRTRTGALVSRLNNDVIGAQRAFSDTLSGRGRQRRHARADAGRDARRSPGRSRCSRWCCCRCSCCRRGGSGGRLAAAASARRPTTTRR